MSLKGKTLFITGASRGIGLAIALRAARDGANIAIAAKSAEAHPKLEGTIFTAAAEIEKAGGRALPLVCDIRFEDQVEAAVAKTAAHFGGIDLCVNNASAIALSDTETTSLKRFDLMMGVNGRGTFLVSQKCLPHLKHASNPHILMLSPPLDLQPKWFAPHLAYSMAKYAMSLCVLGMAEEFKPHAIAVNALWPRTAIATAAVRNLLGGDRLIAMSRTPEIVAEAAHLVFQQPSQTFTGQFLIDDTFLAVVGGITGFDRFSVTPGAPLAPDFFVPEACPPPPGVTIAAIKLSDTA